MLGGKRWFLNSSTPILLGYSACQISRPYGHLADKVVGRQLTSIHYSFLKKSSRTIESSILGSLNLFGSNLMLLFLLVVEVGSSDRRLSFKQV